MNAQPIIYRVSYSQAPHIGNHYEIDVGDSELVQWFTGITPMILDGSLIVHKVERIQLIPYPQYEAPRHCPQCKVTSAGYTELDTWTCKHCAHITPLSFYEMPPL